MTLRMACSASDTFAAFAEVGSTLCAASPAADFINRRIERRPHFRERCKRVRRRARHAQRHKPAVRETAMYMRRGSIFRSTRRSDINVFRNPTSSWRNPLNPERMHGPGRRFKLGVPFVIEPFRIHDDETKSGCKQVHARNSRHFWRIAGPSVQHNDDRCWLFRVVKRRHIQQVVTRLF